MRAGASVELFYQVCINHSAQRTSKRTQDQVSALSILWAGFYILASVHVNEFLSMRGLLFAKLPVVEGL